MLLIETEQNGETNMSENLRGRIMRAIFDPGATEGFKGDRDLTTWQTDAVMRVLAEPDEYRCAKCGAAADERFDCCEVHAMTSAST
jgi:hypothetical protein